MKELNDEIKLTIDLMQGDIDVGAHEELQNHLYSLLELKRNEIHTRLSGPAKPLTMGELKAGRWWCADVSAECANAFKSKGFNVYNLTGWGRGGVEGLHNGYKQRRW